MIKNNKYIFWWVDYTIKYILIKINDHCKRLTCIAMCYCKIITNLDIYE